MYCNLKKIGFFFPVVPYVLQKSLKTDYGLLSLVETRNSISSSRRSTSISFTIIRLKFRFKPSSPNSDENESCLHIITAF